MKSVYSVSQVNAYIKNMFAQDFALNRISIKGEVSNCKYHTSGHLYFTLKDDLGAIQAIMFAGKRRGLSFTLEEGQQVIVKGSVEVYERDGRYQLYANEITLDGTGDLFKRFETLRNQLEEMGMFAPEYKRPIPNYAKTVGIVTAQTGAAIRDIMNIAKRRNPYVQLLLYPVLVQGENAASSIVKGLEVLDEMGLDVLIVGRGGGSIEDLWAFNEEAVARAIFACKTPVISAVGHETDVTIADYVADLRAPTPSAAAELAVFDYAQFEEKLSASKALLLKALKHKEEEMLYRLEQYRLHLRFFHPQLRLNEKRRFLLETEERMEALLEKKCLDRKHQLELLSSRLHGLSPLEKISRGFSFVTKMGGKKVESAGQLKPGEQMLLRLSDGKILAEVLKTEVFKPEKE